MVIKSLTCDPVEDFLLSTLTVMTSDSGRSSSTNSSPP